MKKFKGLINRMVAVSLSGMLIIGSASGSVFASSTDAHLEQISEVVTEDVSSEEEVTETPMNAASEQDIQYYTVTLDANGGYFENEWDDVLGEYIESTESLNKQIPVGETVTTVPVFETDDQQTQVMSFCGWSLERDGEMLLQDQEGYTPVGDCVLYAVWEPVEILDNGEETDIQESDQTEGVVTDDSLVEHEDTEDYSDNADNTQDTENLVDETRDDFPEDQEDTEDKSEDAKNIDDSKAFSEDSADPEETDPERGNGEEQSVDINEEGKEESVRTDAAMSVVASGTCGDNLAWTLDEEGTLTISGTGIMRDYTYDSRIFKNHTIKNVIIEDGVSNIGNNAFSGCSSLTSVTIPDSVTSIGISAFDYCTSLTSVTIPNSVTSIENDTFAGCKALTSVTIPNSVTSIGMCAFQNCTNLTSVTIPNSVTEISTKAFLGCSSLTSMEIPNSVTSIGLSAFQDCSGLTSVIIGNGLNKFDSGIFHNCSSLTSINVGLDNPNFASVDGVLFNKNKTILIQYPYAKNESYTIPDSVTEIGYEAFKNCSILKSMTIPDSVTRIGVRAFFGCSNLTGVTIPDSVTKIGSGAFQNCSSLTSVTIPDSVTSIESYTFMYCSSLTSVEIPDSVTRIGLEAFYCCGSLTSMTIGSGVKDFDVYVFKGCIHLIVYTQNEYVINYCKINHISYVVINTSLKTKFTHLQQNEIKEYYTYYNGSEMKPGFIAEMVGENVSLDRLTYHYEDNNKPGIAKLVIDTLDGDAVKCETKFLILPEKVEKPTVTSENAGEFTVSIKPVEGWKDYQIDVCDKYGSIDGYPKLIKTENINDEGVCIKYIGMLEMDQEYTIKIREVVLIDGILHGGGWSESVSEKTRKYKINKDFWRDVFEVNQWQSCSLMFGTGSLKYTGKGSIRIVEKGTQKEVYSYKLSDIKYNEDREQVIEKDGVQLIFSRYGIQLTVNINAGAIKNTATYFHVKTGDSIIKPDTEYCIVIDPGSIQYFDYDPETGKEVIHDDAFIGIKEGSISVKTIPYALPTYRNPSDFPIDISFYNNLFGPSKGKKVRNYDDGQTGWCFGLSTAVSSYYRGNSGIKSIVDKKSLFTDVKMDTTGNNSVSFEEYVKYAQLYCYTPLVAKQRYNNKNKTSEIIRAVKNKEYPIICFMVFGGAGHDITERHGHAVTGLYVEEENDEKTVIRVYNSSTEKDGNRFTERLTINKDGSWTTQSGNYSSGPLNEISYFIFDETCEQDIMNVDNVAANNYLVFIKANAKPKGDGYRLGRFNGEVMDEPEEEGSYYWSESGIITIESGEINEDGEDREISIIDDNNITTFSFPSSSGIEINKPEGVFNIINNDDLHQSVKVTYEFWDDNDVASEIVIDAISYGNLEIVTDENSISLSGDDEKELSITATDENGNKRKVDVPQSLNDINITKGKKLIVSQDTTKDGNFDTIIAEETFTTDMASKDIILDEIPDQIYTGREIQPECFLKHGDDSLIRNTDYTVDYSNNINAGTATVTITGKGNYAGTKTATFKINKANQSITVKASASSIAVGKTATVSITGAKGTKSYKSSDTSVATVNASTGVVIGKKAGTVTITATSAATSNYNAASKTVKITVNKSLKKPGNCHFAKWNNSKYTSCRIAWNKVDGAEGYETLLSWTNGSHASRTIVKSNVLYRDCTVHPQHVSQMMVRAFYTAGGKRVFGPWSNVEYITPSPTKLTTKNASSGTNLKMNISWNIIYGCNGYNVFLTTNPNGTWYWNQSTSTKADATSAVITKYRGSKLKKNTRYYVRIVTRRKRNGVFCTVPMPASNTYIGSFIIK